MAEKTKSTSDPFPHLPRGGIARQYGLEAETAGPRAEVPKAGGLAPDGGFDPRTLDPPRGSGKIVRSRAVQKAAGLAAKFDAALRSGLVKRGSEVLEKESEKLPERRPAHRPAVVGRPWEKMEPPISKTEYYRRKNAGLL